MVPIFELIFFWKFLISGLEISDDEKAGAAVKNKLWDKWTDTDGSYIVPYFFDKSFPGTAKIRVKKALKVWKFKYIMYNTFVDKKTKF